MTAGGGGEVRLATTWRLHNLRGPPFSPKRDDDCWPWPLSPYFFHDPTGLSANHFVTIFELVQGHSNGVPYIPHQTKQILSDCSEIYCATSQDTQKHREKNRRVL